MKVGFKKSLLLALLPLALASCREKYDYVAETKIEGIILRVELRHSHPFLAEYKRFLVIEQAGKIQKKEIFPDTGGYTWIVVANNGGSLEVKDIGGVQVSAPLARASVGREYLGRFDFIAREVYQFIPASTDSREPSSLK